MTDVVEETVEGTALAVRSLAAALLAAQKKMPTVEKNKTVDSGKFSYRYATLDHLIAKTLPVLHEHGLALVQMPVVTEIGQPALRTILIHGPSGEQLSADMPLFGVTGMQDLGSAITYARRYAWAAALGIASEDDDDGAAASNGGFTRAAASGDPAEFRFPFGKHKGQLIAEIPADYLDWVLREGKQQDVKDAILAWRMLQAEPLQPGDDDIPF